MKSKEVNKTNSEETFVVVPLTWLVEELKSLEPSETLLIDRFPLFRAKRKARTEAFMCILDSWMSVPGKYIEEAIKQYKLDSNPVKKQVSRKAYKEKVASK